MCFCREKSSLIRISSVLSVVGLPLKKKKISFLDRSFCFQNPILRDEIKEKRTKSEFQIRALRTYSCPPPGVLLGVRGNPVTAGFNEAAGALVAAAAAGLAVCGNSLGGTHWWCGPTFCPTIRDYLGTTNAGTTLLIFSDS